MRSWNTRWALTQPTCSKSWRFAQAHHLAVVHADAGRSVLLAGSAAHFNQAFGTELHQYTYPDGTYRGRTGTLSVPAALGDIVQGVFGLDNRPAAEAHFRVRPSPGAGGHYGARGQPVVYAAAAGAAL
ncbi:MAG: protease pro-enzyme activation domain-containing protein [Hymenobacter sp.]